MVRLGQAVSARCVERGETRRRCLMTLINPLAPILGGSRRETEGHPQTPGRMHPAPLLHYTPKPTNLPPRMGDQGGCETASPDPRQGRVPAPLLQPVPPLAKGDSGGFRWVERHPPPETDVPSDSRQMGFTPLRTPRRTRVGASLKLATTGTSAVCHLLLTSFLIESPMPSRLSSYMGNSLLTIDTVGWFQ